MQILWIVNGYCQKKIFKKSSRMRTEQSIFRRELFAMNGCRFLGAAQEEREEAFDLESRLFNRFGNETLNAGITFYS